MIGSFIFTMECVAYTLTETDFEVKWLNINGGLYTQSNSNAESNSQLLRHPSGMTSAALKYKLTIASVHEFHTIAHLHRGHLVANGMWLNEWRPPNRHSYAGPSQCIWHNLNTRHECNTHKYDNQRDHKRIFKLHRAPFAGLQFLNAYDCLTPVTLNYFKHVVKFKERRTEIVRDKK